MHGRIKNRIQIDQGVDRIDKQILQDLFVALKENLFMRRASKIALGSYGMKIVRKYFLSIRQHVLKSVMLKQAYDQVIASRKRKVLNLWVDEYEKV